MIVPFGTDVKVTLIPKIGGEIVPKETIKHLKVCVVRGDSKKGFTPIYKVGDAGIEIEIQRHHIKYPGVYKILLDWRRPDAAYYDGYQDISNSCSFINFSTSCKVVSDNTADIEISPIYKGDDGRGIESITLTSTVGKTNTYTILYTDGTFTTFDVKDGEGAGVGDMLKSIYDKNNDGIVDNASLVNGHSVESDVPPNAKFTDTVYVHPSSHDISFITGLQTALDSKVDNAKVLTDVPEGAIFTDTVTTINGKTGVISKADIVALGIPAQDTVYVHPGGTNPHGTTKADIGLGNVDNTSDLNKPISTSTQNALDLKSNITSPVFIGIPTAPTATKGNNTTQIATTAFVQEAISDGVLGDMLKSIYDTQNKATDVFDYIDNKTTEIGDVAGLATELTAINSRTVVKTAVDSLDTVNGVYSGKVLHDFVDEKVGKMAPYRWEYNSVTDSLDLIKT